MLESRRFFAGIADRNMQNISPFLAIDLISDALPFGRLWYGQPNAISNAVGYAKFYSRSHDAVFAFTMKLVT